MAVTLAIDSGQAHVARLFSISQDYFLVSFIERDYIQAFAYYPYTLKLNLQSALNDLWALVREVQLLNQGSQLKSDPVKYQFGIRLRIVALEAIFKDQVAEDVLCEYVGLVDLRYLFEGNFDGLRIGICGVHHGDFIILDVFYGGQVGHESFLDWRFLWSGHPHEVLFILRNSGLHRNFGKDLSSPGKVPRALVHDIPVLRHFFPDPMFDQELCWIIPVEVGQLRDEDFELLSFWMRLALPRSQQLSETRSFDQLLE